MQKSEIIVAGALMMAAGACGSDDTVSATQSNPDGSVPGAGGSSATGGSIGVTGGSSTAGRGGLNTPGSGGTNSAGSSGASGNSGSGGASGASGSGGAATGGASTGGRANGGASSGGASGSPADAGPTCPSPVAIDSKAAARAACTFVAGDGPTATLGITKAEQQAIPLEHIIVMMKENRSYDHYFGQLPLHGQPDAEPQPATFSNQDVNGQTVKPFHLTTTCVHDDPAHQWAEMHNQVNGGAMDGFVSGDATTRTDGHFVMGYYDDTDMPFYYFLANTFAIADHYFPSVLSGTWPNRDYLLLGTSDGVQATGGGYPGASVPTIFKSLDAKGVSWGVYTDYSPLEGCLNWSRSHAGVFSFAAFKRALADGTLPSVSYVDSRGNVQDEHPTADVQVGEAWTRDVYESVVGSPLWPTTALIWTYDEAGGFADHVPPPNSCVARPGDDAFFELGIRVPTVVISPYARHHFVSHVVHEHTSILRSIETVFDLPALTARDANSDALLDMFDFACPDPTTPAAPAAGTNGCN